MKRDLKMIEEAKKHNHEWYNYKVPAIEEFFHEIEEKLYRTAMEILPAFYEELKKLDVENIIKFYDIPMNDIQSTEIRLKKEKESVERKISAEQNESWKNSNFSNLYDNLRESLKENWRMLSITNIKYFVDNENYSEEVRTGAKLTYDALNRLQKVDKEIKNKYREELKEIKKQRDINKLNKEVRARVIKEVRDVKNKYGDAYETFNIVNLLKNGIENEAKRSSKIETESYKFDLYTRVVEYVGKIAKMDFIHIANSGNLNGIVEGENGKKASVETIIAGGYNIQRAHYRVLVKPYN